MGDPLDERFAAGKPDNGVRRRAPDDVPRQGDGTPWAWDGITLTKAGKPKLKVAGRPSNAGFGSFGLGHYRDGYLVVAVAQMMDELRSVLGWHPQLWKLTPAVRRQVDEIVEEGLRRAGYWTKADRGTLDHKILQRVATEIIAGRSGMDAELDDLHDQAIALGLSDDLMEQSRSAMVELLTSVMVPLASEVHAYNPRFNKLGTADLIGQMLVDVGPVHAGDVVGVDKKTGRADELNAVDHACQLTCYFGPDSMRYALTEDLADLGHPEPWAWPLRRDVALILHTPLDPALAVGTLDVNLVVVDLTAGQRALELADAVAGFTLGDMAVVAHTGNPVITRTVDNSQLLEDLRASVAAVTHTRTVEWLGQRLRAVVKHPLGPPLLVKLWPDADIPRSAVRDKTLTPEHVEPIDRLLAYIEAELHIPWPPNDPRLDLSGGRKSPG